MATLRDIARIVDVNVSTISRYLSGELEVLPETERRIKEAISETNYQPNILARSLRKGKTDTLAVVVPDIYQPGISGIVAGIDQRVSNSDKKLMILMTDNSTKRENEVLLDLYQRRVDGIIIIGNAFRGDRSSQGIEQLEKAKVPRVLVSRNFSISTTVEIAPNQEDGALQMTLHLLERGYSEIGIILGTRQHPGDILKLSGYRQALESKGMAFKEELVEEGLYDPNTIHKVTANLIDEGADAIFCATDTMAITALQYVQHAGLSVPGDIAIAGYGGTDWSDMMTPKLTTVNVHLKQLGITAGDLLLSIIGGESDFSMLNIQPVHLIIKAST